METDRVPDIALEIRPIRGDDRERILQAIQYTSPETYYHRFHAAKHGFTERELTYLTNVDGNDHFALIATECDRPDRLVAIARFIRNPREPQEAELAITVHDPYQHTGVGQRMLGLLIAAADEHNVTRFRAIVQTENRPMITLLHKMLPHTEPSLRDGSTVEYVSQLSDSTRLAA